MRGFWRALAFLAGVYVLLFGIVGVIQTRGMSPFDTHGVRVLGLTTNPGFSIISIVVGAIMVVATVLGRNVDVAVNLVFGALFALAGLFSLAFLRTDLNYFAFSVTNCIVSYVLATICVLASFYGRVRPGVPAQGATATS